ncbi:ABC transporter ATP-binding protein [Peribacillus frigoritolerans]|uniref:ABC transporter ATP-binding protein n=1 Tax=Peribacillus frigoritolerans TaxID=450367 RepID=UPI0010597116|nr:ABC transporter ATP-binding protein [Peribacillus frigoritolerans]TDL80419.1 ABC transporter ATP-binding protein [Peribacillus frigoritolerans]
MALLKIHDLNKRFETEKGQTHALKDIQLSVKDGEFITIIGPSGCGKSTLLKIIAGLDTDLSGSVQIEDEEVKGPSIDKGFIFQEPRLFPWYTVEKNIAANYSLHERETWKKVKDLIQLVKLDGFEKAYPKELSGGMAQRAAIARALLRNPKVLLLDEPFGALDAFTRSHMQEVLLDIWQKNRTTMLFVTHDIDEAIYLGDRVVIMNARPGSIRKIVRIDLPHPRKKTSRSFQEYRQLILNEFEKSEELELVDSAGI